MTFFLVFLACATETTTNEVSDIQAICMTGEDLRVDFAACLSSSCDTLVDATCRVDSADDGYVVTGLATIESSGHVCTSDCGIPQAVCPMPVAQADDVFTYGDLSVVFADLEACAF